MVPNNKENKMKIYVLGFCFSENKSHVALIHKNKPEWQKGLINGIGGKLENNESPFDCMTREFKEETDVEIENWKYFGELQGPEFRVILFKCFTDLVFNVKTVEEEKIEVFNVKNIPFNKTIPNLQWLIPLASDKDNIMILASETK
jgi:8-oxo-dGTP diphosphatase